MTTNTAVVLDLSAKLAKQLDQRNRARIAKEREAQRVAWSDNPIRYENQIAHAVAKLREVRKNDDKVDSFLIGQLSTVKTVR